MKKLLPITLLFVVMTFTSCLLDLITPQDTTPYIDSAEYIDETHFKLIGHDIEWGTQALYIYERITVFKNIDSPSLKIKEAELNDDFKSYTVTLDSSNKFESGETYEVYGAHIIQGHATFTAE